MTIYKPIPSLTAQQERRFWERVTGTQIDAGQTARCWEWTGRKNVGGYGSVSLNDREYPVHRVAYTILRGPIPDGLTLDHLCRNKACCNPAHLDPCTAVENAMRGDNPAAKNARKTHCAKGHELTRRTDDKRRRQCPICTRENQQRHWLKPDRHTAIVRSGRCRDCRKASATYRCEPCRQIHNAREKGRKR
jgi:hypothetical protein